MQFARDIHHRVCGTSSLRARTEASVQAWANRVQWTLDPGEYVFHVKGRFMYIEGHPECTQQICELPHDMMHCKGTLCLAPDTCNPMH